jgi:hypothetical protein
MAQSVRRVLRLIAVCIALSLGLFAVVRGQDVEPPGLWRTLFVSNATPLVGEETELFFEVGNESRSLAWLGGVVCAIQKRGEDDAWTYSTDLIPTSVIDQDGFPVVYFWGDGPLYIVTSIPTNALPPRSRRSYRILLQAVGNTGSENLITCGVEYTSEEGSGYLSDNLFIAIWKEIVEATPEPRTGDSFNLEQGQG